MSNPTGPCKGHVLLQLCGWQAEAQGGRPRLPELSRRLEFEYTWTRELNLACGNLASGIMGGSWGSSFVA